MSGKAGRALALVTPGGTPSERAEAAREDEARRDAARIIGYVAAATPEQLRRVRLIFEVLLYPDVSSA